jgi:hypothetical protein
MQKIKFLEIWFYLNPDHAKPPKPTAMVKQMIAAVTA